MFTIVSLKQISTQNKLKLWKFSRNLLDRQVPCIHLWEFLQIICFKTIKINIFKWLQITLFWGNLEPQKRCLWKDFNFSHVCGGGLQGVVLGGQLSGLSKLKVQQKVRGQDFSCSDMWSCSFQYNSYTYKLKLSQLCMFGVEFDKI